MGRLRDERGWKRLQDCVGWMEFDFGEVQSGDTSPATGGSFEFLTGLSVRDDVLRDLHVACVLGLADVYGFLFNAYGLVMVVRLLSQDGPLTTTTAAFDCWGTRSSRFLLYAGAQPAHHLVILSLPLLLQKDRPLLIHRPRETLPTSPLLGDSAFDNVKTSRMTPASAIVTGNGKAAIFVCEAANAVDGLGC